MPSIKSSMQASARDTNHSNWQKHRNTGYFIAFVFAALTGFFMVSCSKPEPEVPVRVDTLPLPPSSPTGKIEYFTALDTLVGYMQKSNIKWWVTGTNSKTIVTLNGTKVDFQYGMQTWPLSSTTIFTLAINNGVQQSRTIKVADSVTTFLWNEGKRWITNNFRTLTDVPGKDTAGNDIINKVWVSYFDAAAQLRYHSFRTTFSLDGSSTEEQLATNFPKPAPSGKFVLVPWPPAKTGHGLVWKGKVYAIDTMVTSNRELVLSVDSSRNGITTHNRIRYTSEF